MSEQAPGILLLLGSGWRPKVPQAHTLLVNLKPKNGNLKLEKRKIVAQNKGASVEKVA